MALSRIENGSATKVTLIREGKEIEFKATLVKENRYNFVSSLEIFWLSDGKWYFDNSLYSGGSTGCGQHSYTWKEREPEEKFIIITQDIEMMNKIADKKEEIYKREKEEQKKKTAEAIERINTMVPTKIKVPHMEDGLDFVVERGEADIRKVGVSVKVILNGEHLWYFDDYFTRSGGVKKKAFAKDMSSKLNRDIENPKAILKTIKEKVELMKNWIIEAKKG